MAAPPVPRQAIARAMAARAGGASLPEAAEAGPVSIATLKRYLSGQGAGAPPKSPAPAKTTKAAASPPRPVEPPPSATLDALEAGDDGADLLGILRAELRYARGQRRAAETDASRRAWSKRVDELVKAVERLAPPPPPPPDLLAQELRRLDAEVVAILEQHLPEPIDPQEIAA